MTVHHVLSAAAIAVAVLMWRLSARRHSLFVGGTRADVFARWGHKCAYRWVVPHRCSVDVEVDHQWPRRWWGSTRASNGQPLCSTINARKGARHNWPYVLTHGVPVFGWVVYLSRQARAKDGGAMIVVLVLALLALVGALWAVTG